MGNKITNREESFPHIYIKEATDSTSRSEGAEAGAMCGVGYLAYGNPLYPVSVEYTSEKSKSVKTVNGGNPKNETGNPILLVRTEEGNFRGFHNVCRHHAMPVAQGSGEVPRGPDGRQQFVCPYVLFHEA